MTDNLLSAKTLENILQRTRGALEDGRSQMFDVAEAAREECKRTEVILKTVQGEVEQAISDVEEFTRKFAKLKLLLLKSNRDYEEYSEQEKQEVYEDAVEVRESLTIAKERERLLRVRRDALEQTLMKLEEIAAKAERLVSQVGMALNYLSGSIVDMNEQIENIQAREYAGQEILKGQEIERNRMAGEIHDGPVQDLANLVVQFEICERLYHAGRHDEAEKSFASLKSITQGSMAELRRIIYDLNPMTLDDLGLLLTAKNCLDDLAKQTGVETRFVVLGKEERLNNQVERAMFRIIQESLNNCRKHAAASLIEVTVEFANRYIAAEVKDDGVGFDLGDLDKKIKSGKHYGLLSMQSRTKVLGGAVTVQSKLGEGTKILARIPLSNIEGGQVN